MKPTPETDQWETYCDECYYHMWRLRRKTERGWHDGFHIHTGEEAKGLCDLLNNLERERDEAREALAAEIKHHTETTAKWNGHHMDLTIAQCDLNKAIRERDEARGQRDRLAVALQKVLKSWDDETWLDENDIELFREALQSLTPEETISNQ